MNEGRTTAIRVVRHPPERGLPPALYGGACCTTCCCCCCCCAHSAGGLLGAAVATIAVQPRPGEEEAWGSAGRRYWATFGIVLTIAAAPLLFLGVWPVLLVLIILPALQVVASVVELVRSSKMPLEQRSAMQRRLTWITAGSLAGTALGAGITVWMVYRGFARP